MSSNANTEQLEVEKLSIAELISRSKTGQLWAFLVIITGLVVGAFVLGSKTHAAVNEAKINKFQLEKEQLRTALLLAKQAQDKLQAENKLLIDKDRFLSLYLRYVLAKAQRNQSDNQSLVDWSMARRAFDQYVEERVSKGKLRLSKGGGRLATISFADGAVWELPRELHVSYKK